MMALLARLLRLCGFVGLVATLLGFALFVRAGLTGAAEPGESADGIVVLTGGEGRVVRAVELLGEASGSRLLISGANPNVGLDAVRQASGATQALFSCCVDVGQDAANTVGNAAEAAQWAETHGFERLLVVTSDYHMGRALLELQASMPGVELVAVPVAGPPPWSSVRSARRWTVEFFKYVAVYAREAVSRRPDRAEMN